MTVGGEHFDNTWMTFDPDTFTLTALIETAPDVVFD
jgi:hypothetical protein